MIAGSLLAAIQQGASAAAPTALPAVAEGPLPTPQKIVALIVACGMLLITVELVRKRKLREEYSVIWAVTALVLMTLALDVQVLGWLKQLLGADQGTSVLFFGALVFLMLVCLQFSVRLSKLSFQNKTLSQHLALLDKEIEDLRRRERDGAAESKREVPKDGAA